MSIPPLIAASGLISVAPVAVSAAQGVVNQFEKLFQEITSTDSKTQNKIEPASVQKPTSATGDAALNLLQQQADILQQQIEIELRDALNKNGIPIDGSIDFHLDQHGRIKVVGEHPQQVEIEKALATHPELRDRMAQLSGLSTLLKAAKPQQAVASNASSKSQEFQLRVTAIGSDILS